jgi:AcrR family transcriptional regulator
MSPPTDKGEETRQRILRLATVAFAARGYDGTSLNELIRETGLTKGGFYFHFASKEALADAVFIEAKRLNEQDVLAGIDHEARALDRLASLVRGAFAKSATDLNIQALRRLNTETDVARRLSITSPCDRWAALTKQLLDEAQAEGDLPAGLDTHAAAYFSVSAYFGLEDALGCGSPQFIAMCEPFIEFTFRGMGAGIATPAE